MYKIHYKNTINLKRTSLCMKITLISMRISETAIAMKSIVASKTNIPATTLPTLAVDSTVINKIRPLIEFLINF